LFYGLILSKLKTPERNSAVHAHRIIVYFLCIVSIGKGKEGRKEGRKERRKKERLKTLARSE
jgi:hypothetical protein